MLEEEGFVSGDKICFEYINTGANLGGAGGFKKAFEVIIEKDTSKKIWLMDDDVEADKECLKNLLQHSNSGNIVQPVRYYKSDNSYARFANKTINLDSPSKNLVLGHIEQSELTSSTTFNIECVPFEGPLIDREVIDNVGLPDSDYFIFFDDTDYSYRAIQQGYSIQLCSEALLFRQIKPVANKSLSWKDFFCNEKSGFI